MIDNEIAPDGAFCITDSLSPEELLIREQLNLRYGTTASKSDKIDDIVYQISTSELEHKEAHIIHKKANKELGIKRREITGKEDHKYTTQMGVDGVNYMLDTKENPSKTLEYVRNKHDKTLEWLSHIRGKKFYTQVDIINRVEEQRRDIIEKLKSNGTYIKTTLTNAETPVQQLKHLHHTITMSDRLDMLEYRQQQTDIKLAEYETRLTLAEHNISSIDNKIGISKAEKKQLAFNLKQDGMTYSEISSQLGVSVRTIKYWMKEIR